MFDFAGLGWFLFLLKSLVSSSAGYQVLALFLNLLWVGPPCAIKMIKLKNT
jgi:hypothetical protein